MRRFFNRVKKLYDWCVFLWSHEDWDFFFIFSLLEFKLKRVQKQLIAGPAEHPKEILQSLRLCIRLSKSLSEKDYHDREHKLFELKWGETYYEFPKLANGYCGFISKNPKANTEEEKEQCKKDRLTYHKIGDNIRARDKRLLFAILDKYIEGFWD